MIVNGRGTLELTMIQDLISEHKKEVNLETFIVQ